VAFVLKEPAQEFLVAKVAKYEADYLAALKRDGATYKTKKTRDYEERRAFFENVGLKGAELERALAPPVRLSEL
jgi:hypothetical protein